LTKFQSIFFTKCFRFGNNSRVSLHFTKKMSKNFVIERMQLWVAIIFWLCPIAATSYCGNMIRPQGSNHVDLVAAIASCCNRTSTATQYYIGVLTKFQNLFFKTCFRFGNKTPDSLQFTNKMTENFGIEQAQLWVAVIFWLSPIAATSYCGNKVQMIRPQV
jgi:hypothetical protein